MPRPPAAAGRRAQPAAIRSASPPIATAQATAAGPGTAPSKRSSRVAAGGRAGGREGDPPAALAVERDHRGPEPLAAVDRALDLARRRRPRSSTRWPVAHGQPRPARAASSGSVSVLEADRGARRAARRGGPRVSRSIEREAVVEQLERRRVALALGRRPEHRGDQLDAVALGRADEHVAGAERVAGLDPVDVGHRADERVAVDDRRAVGRRSVRVASGVSKIAPEDRVLAQLDRQRRRGRGRSRSCPPRRGRSGSRRRCRRARAAARRGSSARRSASSEPAAACASATAASLPEASRRP